MGSPRGSCFSYFPRQVLTHGSQSSHWDLSGSHCVTYWVLTFVSILDLSVFLDSTFHCPDPACYPADFSSKSQVLGQAGSCVWKLSMSSFKTDCPYCYGGVRVVSHLPVNAGFSTTSYPLLPHVAGAMRAWSHLSGADTVANRLSPTSGTGLSPKGVVHQAKDEPLSLD